MLSSCTSEVSQSDAEVLQIDENLFVVVGGNGRGSNVGVFVGADEVVLVDAMTEEANQHLLSAIHSITDKPVTYVINTHSDSDHAGGNAFFSDRGATIISHENAEYSNALWDSTFSDTLSLQIGPETIRLHHVVSHAFDDVIIAFDKSNAVFLGDVFTTRWHPTFSSGGASGQRSALSLAFELANNSSSIVPGHGTITKRDELLLFSQRTDLLVARVGELFGRGVPVTSIANDDIFLKTLSEFNVDEREVFVVGDRLVRFIERIISTEFVDATPLNNIESFAGLYTVDDVRLIEIVVRDGKLYALAPGDFIAELIPQRNGEFHIRGSLGDSFNFNLDRTDSVDQFLLRRGEETLTGNRILAAEEDRL